MSALGYVLISGVLFASVMTMVLFNAMLLMYNKTGDSKDCPDDFSDINIKFILKR